MLNYKIGQKSNLKLQHFSHFSQVKLPLLQKKPSDNFKKSLSKIRSGRLPLLHFHETNANTNDPVRREGGSQMATHTEMDAQLGNNGNFAQQIGERVNSILNKNHMFNMDYYASDGENFELNIAKNKEYLKEQRGKRISVLRKKEVEGESPKEKEEHSAKKGEGLRKKEERVKAVSKAKRRNKSPAVPNSKSESVLSNDDSAKAKGGFTNRLEKKMHELKKKLGNRKKDRQSKLVTDGDVEDAKSENLFDNIHNYLANPQRLSFDSKNLVSNKISNKKKALQAKLKVLQQKLATLDQDAPQNEQNKPETIPLTGRSRDEYGVSDWRRMQFQSTGENKMGKHLSMRESNFEKEVNHINILQQRNQQSLQRYLENQRLLFDLKMMRSSKDQPREFRSK